MRAPGTDYEAFRRDRIRQNQEKIKELGIVEASLGLSSLTPQLARHASKRSETNGLTSAKRKLLADTQEIKVPRRKSARLALLPPRAAQEVGMVSRLAQGQSNHVTIPGSNCLSILQPQEDYVVLRKRQISQRPSSRMLAPFYRPRIPVPPQAGQEALEAALRLAERLGGAPEAQAEGEGFEGGPASGGAGGGAWQGGGSAAGRAVAAPWLVRSMMPSQVAGGFWLHLDASFCRTHLPSAIATVTLEVRRPAPQGPAAKEEGEGEGEREGDSSARGTALPARDPQTGERGVAGAWEVVYLPGKHGLSGGWKRFAEEQRLDAGDAVLFRLVAATRFEVHVIRAFDQPSADFDYDAQASSP